MLIFKGTRTLACSAGLPSADGWKNISRSTILHRPTTTTKHRCPRPRISAGCPLRLGVSCTASLATNDRPAAPQTPTKLDFRRLASIVELAVLPVGCIILWRAASLPIEALLCAAYWGLQIAMPVPLLRKLGLGLNTSLAASAAVVGAMWTAIYRYLLCPCSLTPLTAQTELTFHIPDVVWERICASAWTKNANVYTTPFKLMTGAERLVLLLPVLLSAAMIGALLLVHKKAQAGGGSKTAVVAEPVSESASDDTGTAPRAQGALPPVSGWPFPCFGGGAGFGLGGSIPLPEIPPPTSGEDKPAEQEMHNEQEEEPDKHEEGSQEKHPAPGEGKYWWTMAPGSGSAVHRAASVESPQAPSGQEARKDAEEAASPAVAAADQLEAPGVAKEGAAERVVALSASAEHDPNEELRRLARTESSDLVEALLLMSQRVAVLEKQALRNAAGEAPSGAEAPEEKLKQMSSEMEAFMSESRERMDSWEKIHGNDPASLERISAIMETVQTQGQALLAKGSVVDDLEDKVSYLDDISTELHNEANYLRNERYREVYDLLPKLKEGLKTLEEERPGTEDSLSKLMERLKELEGKVEELHSWASDELDKMIDKTWDLEGGESKLEMRMDNCVTKAELDSKLQSLEGDSSVAQRLAALEGRLEHLKGSQDNANRQLEEALSKVEELKLGSLETDRDAATDAKGDLEARLAKFVTQKEVEDQLQDLLEDDEMATRVIRLEENVELLEKYQASMEGELEALVSRKELEEKLAPLEADLKALNDAKGDLEERLEDYVTQAELDDKLESLESDEDVADMVSNLEASLATLKDEQGDLEARVDLNDSVFSDRLCSLEEKVENIHQMGVDVRELERVKIDLEERMSALEEDSPLGSAVEALQERLDTLQYEEEVVDRLRSLEKDLEGLQAGTVDLQAVKKRLEALEQAQGKNEEFNKLAKDFAELAGNLETIEEALASRVADLMESSESAEADIGKLEDRLDVLEADEDVADRLASVEKGLQALQAVKLEAASTEGQSRGEELEGRLRELIEKSTLDTLERIKKLQTEISSLASADQVKYADFLLAMEAGADLPGSKPFLEKLKEWTAAHPPTVRIAGEGDLADLTEKPQDIRSSQLAKEWIPRGGDPLPKGVAPDDRQLHKQTFWHARSLDPEEAGKDEDNKGVVQSAPGLILNKSGSLVANSMQESETARAERPEEAKAVNLSDQWLAALSPTSESPPTPAIADVKAAEGNSLTADSFSVEVQDVEGTEDVGEVLVEAEKAPEASNGLKERPKWVGLPNASGADPAASGKEADEFEVEVDDYSDEEEYTDDFEEEEEEDVEEYTDDFEEDDGLSDLDYDSMEEDAVGSDDDATDSERDFYLEVKDEDEGSDGEGDYFKGRKDDDDTVG